MEKESKKAKGLIVKGKNVALRGRKFEGYVIAKFDKRVTIQFEKVKLIRKYERYSKQKTKMHAYLPEEMKGQIEVGDYIQIIECRPLSKIVHHVVVKKINNQGEENESS